MHEAQLLQRTPFLLNTVVISSTPGYGYGLS
jgi:hypothetical protein